MRHGMSGRKLNRSSAHRKAMFCNMATSLLEHEQIRTTLPKAKDLRGVVEKLITKALKGDLAARREVAKVLKSDSIVKKLMNEIAPRFTNRPGGYTRVLKAGYRQGDNAPMAIIELTEQAAPASTKASAAPAKAPAKKAAAPKAEAKPAAKKAPAKKAEAKAAK